MAVTVMFQCMMQVLLLLSCNDVLKFDWSCQLSGCKSNSNNLRPGNKINFLSKGMTCNWLCCMAVWPKWAIQSILLLLQRSSTVFL